MDVLQTIPKEILLLEDVVHTLCEENWWFLFLSTILVFFSMDFSIREMYEQYIMEVNLFVR
jgi:hypothetical protein